MANAGAVIRRGAVVERPAPPTAHALHAHLLALRAHGFDGAPVPLALTGTGREQLTFLPGDVPLSPHTDDAMTESALASVGSLLRRLHEVSAAVSFDASAPWPHLLSDPEGGAILCHNDVCPGNVVFRGGRAVALIDFDMAAPGRPVWDLAMAARYWVPMHDRGTGSPSAATDVARRLRILADGYGLSRQERRQLPEVIEQAMLSCRAFVADRVANSDPVYVRSLAESGGWDRWDRMQSWLLDNRDTFRAALTG
ncbi:phosphotransferase [Microbacterium lushaniae]|nr:phosphotransferase [Microbacterium lushaniae]KAA9144150.1 phosphotransferase [Microbacterium lushaniae]